MKSANEVLAENLNRLMQEKGWNNLALGKAAGLAPNTIKNYRVFDPGRSAKISEVESLAAALKVSILDLLTERGPLEAVPSALSKTQQQLILDLDDLAPTRQSQLFDLVHQEAEAVREAVKYHERKRSVSAAAKREPEKATTSVRHDEEHPRQRQLPLRTVRDPFNAEPGHREAELYKRFTKTPKARG
jgi:DNA-binding Xre family transcriptional regulator